MQPGRRIQCRVSHTRAFVPVALACRPASPLHYERSQHVAADNHNCAGNSWLVLFEDFVLQLWPIKHHFSSTDTEVKCNPSTTFCEQLRTEKLISFSGQSWIMGLSHSIDTSIRYLWRRRKKSWSAWMVVVSELLWVVTWFCGGR